MTIQTLTKAQYELLMQLSGYKGAPPLPGFTAAIGHGLTVSNNTDLPKARAADKAHCVECNGDRLGAFMIRAAMFDPPENPEYKR